MSTSVNDAVTSSTTSTTARVKPPAPKPQQKPTGKPLPIHNTYHRKRKLIQLGCFLIFLALPFFNVMRFDIPRQRFFFAGYELWINEFAIIFFSLLFLLYVIAAASMLYGRMYCGYLCPQMIFSEASLKLEERLTRLVNKRFIKLDKQERQVLTVALFYGVLLLASVFLAFVFIAYFVEPRDLLHRLLSLDIKTVGGIAGATTTLITFLDFAFVRTRFCTTICPYGYLQGMFGDKHILIVEYRDDNKNCIECKKCVRVCHMGIDIRQSPYQIECIHCGECIDACDDMLGHLGKPGLIQYTWGEHSDLLKSKQRSWRQRLGLRDAKRIVVLLILLFYASGLFVALALRHNVIVQIAAPISKEPGSPVVAGSVNLSNVLRIRAAKVGAETTLVQIIKLVEHALSSRSDLDRAVDRTSSPVRSRCDRLCAADVNSVLAGRIYTRGRSLDAGDYCLGNCVSLCLRAGDAFGRDRGDWRGFQTRHSGER